MEFEAYLLSCKQLYFSINGDRNQIKVVSLYVNLQFLQKINQHFSTFMHSRINWSQLATRYSFRE